MSKSPDPTPQPPAADPNLTKPWPQTQHTPEPWYLAQRYGELEIYSPEAHTFRQIIARIHHTAGARNKEPSSDRVALANAKLLLAAPRLLRLVMEFCRPKTIQDLGEAGAESIARNSREALEILRELGVRP